MCVHHIQTGRCGVSGAADLGRAAGKSQLCRNDLNRQGGMKKCVCGGGVDKVVSNKTVSVIEAKGWRKVVERWDSMPHSPRRGSW